MRALVREGKWCEFLSQVLCFVLRVGGTGNSVGRWDGTGDA